MWRKRSTYGDAFSMYPQPRYVYHKWLIKLFSDSIPMFVSDSSIKFKHQSNDTFVFQLRNDIKLAAYYLFLNSYYM